MILDNKKGAALGCAFEFLSTSILQDLRGKLGHGFEVYISLLMLRIERFGRFQGLDKNLIKMRFGLFGEERKDSPSSWDDRVGVASECHLSG